MLSGTSTINWLDLAQIQQPDEAKKNKKTWDCPVKELHNSFDTSIPSDLAAGQESVQLSLPGREQLFLGHIS